MCDELRDTREGSAGVRRYPDGTRVPCLAMLDLRDGLIVRQAAVQEWDA